MSLANTNEGQVGTFDINLAWYWISLLLYANRKLMITKKKENVIVNGY